MRMQAAASEEIGEANIASDGEEDVELIGWRTRLVQRLGKGNQTATTITPTYSAATPSPNTAMANTITQALQNHFVPDQVLHTAQAENGGNQNYDQGTDTLVSPPPISFVVKLIPSAAPILGPYDASRAHGVRRSPFSQLATMLL